MKHVILALSVLFGSQAFAAPVAGKSTIATYAVRLTGGYATVALKQNSELDVKVYARAFNQLNPVLLQDVKKDLNDQLFQNLKIDVIQLSAAELVVTKSMIV